uniref:Uncharacterized protein n=1 Tax=Leersia perrieri TaxID=77586 RepID=A0A0D9XF27_9ORYZ
MENPHGGGIIEDFAGTASPASSVNHPTIHCIIFRFQRMRQPFSIPRSMRQQGTISSASIPNPTTSSSGKTGRQYGILSRKPTLFVEDMEITSSY